MKPYSILMGVLLMLAPSAHAQARPKAPAKPAHSNVVLITIDTLRADHVGAYGSTTAKTPAIDALARDGMLFENAASQVPLTLASHASILTGTYPFSNGVQDFTGEPLGERFQTLAQAFRRNGYATAAVVSAFVLDRSWGLARGFDHYDDQFPAQSFQTRSLGLVDRRAAESVARAIAWLKQRPAGKPFFLWLHLYDPHSPYDPPQPFEAQYRDDPYSGEIAYADSELARFFAYLKAQHLYDLAAIVLLSDHGESLGEHGEREHGFFAYLSTTHVPLIVKPPRSSAAHLPSRVQGAVEAVAVAPTLLELSGVHDAALERQLQSKTLLAPQAASAETAAYSETYYPFSSFGWSPLRALRTRELQYVEAPKAELYLLSEDAGETHNAIQQRPAVAQALKSRLQALTAKYPAASQTGEGSGLSSEAIEKLRALGYVAYKSPASSEAIARGLADPKDKVDEFNAILSATDAMEAGDFAKVQALLAGVEKSDPEMYLVPFLLGEAATRQKDWAGAKRHLQQALKLNPQFDQAMTALARAQFESGEFQEATSQLDRALKLNPHNFRAWYQRAWTRWRAQDTAGAREGFEQALRIQPGFALAERDLGMLLFSLKDYAAALPHLQRAIALELDDKQTLNTAGIAANQAGKPAAAEKYYRQALRADPDYAEAHLNLGLALQKLGKQAESREEYQAACRLEARYCSLIPRP